MSSNRFNFNVSSNEGFSYMDVVIAFMLFGLMFVFVSKIGNSIFEVNRVHGLQNQMLYMAELQIENYKTAINNPSAFIAASDFVVVDEVRDGDSQLVRLELKDSDLEDQFSVRIVEEVVDDSLSDVTVTVTSNDSQVKDVKLSARLIKDYP